MIGRVALIVALAVLGGCGASPASLGLTGATQVPPPVAPSDANIGTPGVSQGTQEYTPSLIPSTGPGQYDGTN